MSGQPTRLQSADPVGRRFHTAWLLPASMFMLLLAPVVLLAGAGNPPQSCPAESATAGGTARTTSDGLFAQPLELDPGKWYRVGATEYGGPSDPASGDYGSSGAYLPLLPDSFAELSLLDTNPTSDGGTLTFADANALSSLPYGSALRVVNGRRQAVLIKRDIGYGQGPGQPIVYRLDLWWRAAEQLGVSKTSVLIELAPGSGTAATLDQLPNPASPNPLAGGPGCQSDLGALSLTPGRTAKILANGEAAAPADAPEAVKLAIAAGNQLIDKPYLWGGGHGLPLTELANAYDCSSATSYILHGAGLLGDYADDSTQLETYGGGGPGSWITVYANSAHAFIDVAGVVMDTAWYAPVTPSVPGSGPRWQPESMIGAQYAGDESAGNGGFVQRHPEGL